MSFVGPRPEQPEFVELLERLLPFYERRHLIRPGLTGWAQVRCGYARSERDAAWKLCNDLYYVKHRSMGLDLLLLAETAGLLLTGARTAPPRPSALGGHRHRSRRRRSLNGRPPPSSPCLRPGTPAPATASRED